FFPYTTLFRNRIRLMNTQENPKLFNNIKSKNKIRDLTKSLITIILNLLVLSTNTPVTSPEMTASPEIVLISPKILADLVCSHTYQFVNMTIAIPLNLEIE